MAESLLEQMLGGDGPLPFWPLLMHNLRGRRRRPQTLPPVVVSRAAPTAQEPRPLVQEARVSNEGGALYELRQEPRPRPSTPQTSGPFSLESARTRALLFFNRGPNTSANAAPGLLPTTTVTAAPWSDRTNPAGIPYEVSLPPTFADNGRVFRRRDRLLYESNRQWRDRKRSTHSVRMLPPDVQRGERTVEAWEDEVLARAANSFGPEVQSVVNNLDALNPDTKSQFERLVEAARAAGVSLRVNETRRPQDRQEWLFQQGRSRPGPIVTWTLTSNHREGNALDLVMGSDAGYQWLWENAAKFGFRALGPSDPGHIERVGRPTAAQQGAALFAGVNSGSSTVASRKEQINRRLLTMRTSR